MPPGTDQGWLLDLLQSLWCQLAHRDKWLGHGEGDWWHLECPRCGVKWEQPR